MNTLDSLIAAATAKAAEVVTISRADGSTYQGSRGYACVDDGVVQVYVVTVDRRTSTRAMHYRATFYVKCGGAWKRTNRATVQATIEGANNA